MKTFWGLSYGHHDAAVVVMQHHHVRYAKRIAQITGIEQDSNIPQELVWQLADQYGTPDAIFLHENKTRDMWRKVRTLDWTRWWNKHPKLPRKPIVGNHHLSHAATGFYTSPFDEAIIIVADAIGENESLVVYEALDGLIQPTPLMVSKYPHSLGLYYSYCTSLVGLRPGKDEYKLMHLSQESTNRFHPAALSKIHFIDGELRTTSNLHYRPVPLNVNRHEKTDIACTAQHVLEQLLVDICNHFGGRDTNVVFAGGVAFNALACKRLERHVKQLWVSPSPGDAGSALGAILQHTKTHICLPNNRLFV